VSTSYLLLSVVFSASGLGFFIYGKNQKAVVPMVCGVALMIYPYFVGSTIVMVVVGVILMAVPYFIRY
jgi:hypothetical protein